MVFLATQHPPVGPARCAMPADMTALQTMMGRQQFCEEPTARNSKRLPQKGKGAVRLRSSTLASMCMAALQPVSWKGQIQLVSCSFLITLRSPHRSKYCLHKLVMTKEVCGDQKTSKSPSTFPAFPDGCFISFQIWFRPQINLKKCNLLQYHGSLLLLLFSFISLDLLKLKKKYLTFPAPKVYFLGKSTKNHQPYQPCIPASPRPHRCSPRRLQSPGPGIAR